LSKAKKIKTNGKKGKEPKVTIIVLTHNSVSKLGKFFNKVVAGLTDTQLECADILFVDNNSSDDTVNHIRRQVLSMKLSENSRILELKENYGWTGGNNRGAIISKDADYLMFLNDDTTLEPHCISKLVNLLENNKDLAAVQPIILDRDGHICCGHMLGISGYGKEITQYLTHPKRKIFFASGAAFLTRTNIFFQVGMFDEDLFIYHDDLDYSWRLRLVGYDVACATNAYAYHLGKSTFGEHGMIRYMFRNNIWVCAKNSNLLWFFLRFFLMTFEFLITYVLWDYLHEKKDPSKALLAIRSFLEGLTNIKKGLYKRKNVIRTKSDSDVLEFMEPILDLYNIFRHPKFG
jgi:GT2 family glycosyltransferase